MGNVVFRVYNYFCYYVLSIFTFPHLLLLSSGARMQSRKAQVYLPGTTGQGNLFMSCIYTYIFTYLMYTCVVPIV